MNPRQRIPRREAILSMLAKRPMTAQEVATRLYTSYAAATSLLCQYAIRGDVVRGDKVLGLIRWRLTQAPPELPRARRDPTIPAPRAIVW